MFALDLPKLPRRVHLTARAQGRALKDACVREQPFAPQQLIFDTLAQMVPSTAAEVAEVTGLDPTTAEACLDGLAARYRVMFNPLTKRFSLPRAGSHAIRAA